MPRFFDNAGKPWSQDEVAALKHLADGVHSTDDIARILKRSPAAVALKASQERISLRVERPGPAQVRSLPWWQGMSAII